MLAVGQGDLEMARKLLDAGADPNARQEQPFGNTALRIATAEGTLEMVKLLMSAGADPLLPGRMTLTPLDRARERNTPEGRMITFFIERTLAAAKAAKSRPRRAKRATATRARK
jgi:ankyrin repeat protein